MLPTSLLASVLGWRVCVVTAAGRRYTGTLLSAEGPGCAMVLGDAVQERRSGPRAVPGTLALPPGCALAVSPVGTPGPPLAPDDAGAEAAAPPARIPLPLPLGFSWTRHHHAHMLAAAGVTDGSGARRRGFGGAAAP